MTNSIPVQINDTTPSTHTHNPKTSTIASHISRSNNKRVEGAKNIIAFNLKEQSKESDKNTIMNLCKFIVDHEVTCKTS